MTTTTVYCPLSIDEPAATDPPWMGALRDIAAPWLVDGCGEIQLAIDVHVSGGCKGKYDGRWEDCYPSEEPDVDLESITIMDTADVDHDAIMVPRPLAYDMASGGWWDCVVEQAIEDAKGFV